MKLDPELLAGVRRGLATAAAETEPDGELGRWVRQEGRAKGVVLGAHDLAELTANLRAELVGAGPLQPLLDEPGVTDVLVNGPTSAWVDRGRGLEPRTLDLGGAEELRALAVRLAASGGQRLDDARPVVDARLRDGTRLHAVLPPVAPDGALLSLRVPRRSPFTLAELVASATVHPDVEPVLRALVAGRANGLLTGGTGTGKTTLLSTLLSAADPSERLVCVEEVPELAPTHPHVVRLVVRRPNIEGAGGVDLADLVRHALRMRPDRIVLGEARGAEIREVLTAFNTGHDGGWATLHANTVDDIPARLAALGAQAGMTREALDTQVAGAVDVVVHLERSLVDGHVARRVVQVALLDGGTVRSALSVRAGLVYRGPAWPVLVERWPLANR